MKKQFKNTIIILDLFETGKATKLTKKKEHEKMSTAWQNKAVQQQNVHLNTKGKYYIYYSIV